jgi:hypothetical protein
MRCKRDNARKEGINSAIDISGASSITKTGMSILAADFTANF